MTSTQTPPRLGHIDRSSGRALFRQIADHLRQAITAGRYGTQGAIPSEKALSAHFGVARMTIRQALQVLRDEGIVEAKQGRGVFVHTRPQPTPAWPPGVPRVWLLPTGLPPLLSGPCLGIEGRPGTFIAQSRNGWSSHPITHMPTNAQPLLPA